MLVRFIRHITTAGTGKVCPLSYAIYVRLQILLFWWGYKCFGPHPAALPEPKWPFIPQSWISTDLLDEISTSGSQRQESTSEKQFTLLLTLEEHHLPTSHSYSLCYMRDSAILWYSREVPRRIRNWSSISIAPSLSLSLSVHGRTSNRDQLYALRHTKLLFFCGRAKYGSYSKYKGKVSLKETQVVCWFHSGHFSLEPSSIIVFRSGFVWKVTQFTKGSECIEGQQIGLCKETCVLLQYILNVYIFPSSNQF